MNQMYNAPRPASSTAPEPSRDTLARRAVRISALGLIALTLAAASRPVPAAPRSQTDAGLPSLPPSARFDATLTRLFTPPSVPQDTYRVYLTAERIGLVSTFFRSAPGASSSAGAWRVEALDPLTALGTAGPYDRALVARLYMGQPVSVARGTIAHGGRVTFSITLLSPHPNPQLSALDSGTMIVVFRIPALL